MKEEILECAKRLYLEGNSIREVARIIFQTCELKIGIETIRSHLQNVISLRTRKEALVLKRGNEIHDEKVVELYAKGQSLKQIAKMFNASASGIKYILVKNNVMMRSKRDGIRIRIAKYEKPAFHNTKEEKAYLMGITLGDLNIRYTSNFTIEANTATTHEAMIKLLVNTFEKHTDGINWYPDPKKGFRFSAYLDKSFDFLILVKRNVDIIRKFNKKEFLAFLAGFFDAEGCITEKRKKFPIIKIGNTNKAILDIIKEKLEELGTNSHLYLYSKKKKYHFYNGRKIFYRKPYYMIEIGRKEHVRKLLGMLEIRHAEKIERKNWALDLLNSSLHAG